MVFFNQIINPVKVDETSDLFIAQPIIFESIRNAKHFAQDKGMQINNYTIQYEEDISVVPNDFEKLPNLRTSVLDYFQFQYSRKLPLICDLLDEEKIKTRADFYIYSNVDIGLMPHFYFTIHKLISEGYDAIAINRRTVSADYTSVADLPLIYGELGEYHKGIDCFVFSKSAYEKFTFEKAFIGSGAVGLAFVANMITHSTKFIWLENQHLTFHIGNDRSWQASSYKDYQIINNREIQKIIKASLTQLSETEEIKKKVLSTMLLQLEIILSDLEKKKVKYHIQYKAKDFIRWYSQGDYDKILSNEMLKSRKRKFLNI